MPLNINQDVFCCCDLDILEYRVIEVRHAEDGTFYVLKSKHSVGSHGSLKILVAEGKAGILRYIELVDCDDDCEYGLHSFTEGSYHLTLEEAKSAYAKQQINLIDREVSNLTKRIEDYKRSKSRWEKMLIQKEES